MPHHYSAQALDNLFSREIAQGYSSWPEIPPPSGVGTSMVKCDIPDVTSRSEDGLSDFCDTLTEHSGQDRHYFHSPIFHDTGRRLYSPGLSCFLSARTDDLDPEDLQCHLKVSPNLQITALAVELQA